MDAGLLAPNVIWTGDNEAPTAVNVGAERIELPDDAAQRAGFCCDRAHVLVSLGLGWKVFIGRGE